jgi:hypothetical protein
MSTPRLALALLLAALTACALDDDAPDELGEVVQDLEALACPGHGHTPGIASLRGFSGTYLRLGLPAEGEPARLVLTSHRDEAEAEGNFTGTWPDANVRPTIVSGRFAALPDNPAIGAFISFDFGPDGEWDQGYFIVGSRRSFTGKVSSLCLVAGKSPFVLQRASF